jgi:antitoxin component YwqK of YwqJK toxin-antitoxin module
MKIALLLLVSVLHYAADGQKRETFYDYNWQSCSSENARYYSILEKTDSGWLRQDYFLSRRTLQMQALYEDNACKIQNGFYRYYYASGYPSSVGRKIHGKQEGICISYHSNGMMSDSALYHEGRVVDKKLSWHPNGYNADSTSRLNDSTEVQVGWFEDGVPAYAGYLVNGKQNGKWKYFHHNGQMSSLEIYNRGNMLSAEYFDEKGQPQTDTSNVGREATFKGGLAAWKKYLEKNLYWPANLQFTTAASVTIGIDFTIDENGKPEDVEVSVPFHLEFDRIALNIIKNSPAWIPGIAHNRKVKAYRRQPITFQQPD